MKTLIFGLFYLFILLWFAWTIGYPIYRKINHKPVFDDDNVYPLVCLALALMLDFCSGLCHLVA